MIKNLYVKDFAIIEDLSIDFSSGFTVLTGQTGAGKSLIIDTLTLLLGGRSDTLMIRYGKPKAYIKGVFDYNKENVDRLLENYLVPVFEDLTIEREISKSKSIVKINGIQVTLQALKDVAMYLGDIHTQNDTFKLFNQETYLNFVDPKTDSKFNEILNDYIIKLSEYTDAYNKYQEILNKKNESLKNYDMMEFTLNELKDLDLKIDEDKEVYEKIIKLSNYDKIYSNLEEAINLLENSNFDNIYSSLKNLEKISSYDTKYDELNSRINDAYYQLDDALQELKKDIRNLDYDEQVMNELQERQNIINNAILKYKKSVNEIIKYKEELELEIKLVNNYDEVLKDYFGALKNKFEIVKQSAIKLSLLRKERASLIEKKIINICANLELKNTNFKIEFSDITLNDPLKKEVFKENGIDNIEFMISTNKGEPLMPLSKVASGGEMSRIMLAFKSVLLEESKLSFVVFDEIDTGVSGKVALEIGNQMKDIAKHVQVLSITHLPQVAAKASNHILIYKEELDERTFTKIKYLLKEDRIKEIAKMISGELISTYAMQAAKDLLEN